MRDNKPPKLVSQKRSLSQNSNLPHSESEGVGGIIVPERVLDIKEIVHEASAEECDGNSDSYTITLVTVSTYSQKVEIINPPILNFDHTGKLDMLIRLLEQVLKIQPRISIITFLGMFI